METLGSLCDKLIVVKLKQYHTIDNNKLKSLLGQEAQLIEELDAYLDIAVTRVIPEEYMSFKANKVARKMPTHLVDGSIGNLVAILATINSHIWHIQDKMYEFDKVPVSEKDALIRQISQFNLQRNNCIESIDTTFTKLVLK